MNLKPLHTANNTGVYFHNSVPFIRELADYLQDKRVLEVFAGNGLLAGLLAAEGVQIKSTSHHSGSDGHHHGFYYPVENLSAVEAVSRYGDSHDVLLMSWPTVTEAAYKAAALMNKPIVVIGEVTNYARNELGGCATDFFWACAQTIKTFHSYQGRGLDKAQVVEMSPRPSADFVKAQIEWELRYARS